ncbi:ABC-2 transporter permease [Bifidobacterium platyrrhinorum]|uniref:ABC-2 transporter permease n=1 Tax=Bifidobacterium platyrrhinorum TaxID=2661628 RepID=A0A6L9ST67_9BIFI|nr:ABC-2 transporter permease [Bifidobacterium platyrrhinorum]NEG55738.1 hypothetical protein [Bifidobacterium platyrrhinorum]
MTSAVMRHATPVKPAGSPKDLRRAARRRAMMTALRMDFAAICGNSAVAASVMFLLPLPLCLFGQNLESPALSAVAVAMMAFLTMLYCGMLVGMFFRWNGGALESRMIGVMPVSRRTQVDARYLSAMMVFGVCLVQIGAEVAIAIAAFGLDAGGLWVVPYAAALFPMLAAIQLPVFYASDDWLTAYHRMVRGGMALFFAAVIILHLIPDGVRMRVIGMHPAMPVPGWALLWLVAAIALAVSHHLSVRLWSAREL